VSGEPALEKTMDLSWDTLHSDNDDDDDDVYNDNTSTLYMKVMILFSVNIHLNSWVLP
jgi:hypothetical protein